MATIYPFSPIRPNPLFAGHLVFAKPQAESISGDFCRLGGLQPLKDLLELPARLRPETAEGQAKACTAINDTLDDLLNREQLWQEKHPGIYIYEVSHYGYSQTGIWCLTDIRDYQNGHIKRHELTLVDSIRRLTNYRAHTGLEGSPVLLTYYGEPEIDSLIAKAKKKPASAVFGNAEGFHRLWLMSDAAEISKLQTLFAGLPAVYLADGHHRLEAAATAATPHPVSSLYMATDQLRIEAYHRIVLPEKEIHKECLFREVSKSFYIRESTGNAAVLPDTEHCLGMCLENEWYHLRAKASTYMDRKAAEAIDAALLQDYLLEPVFAIEDPQSDQRLLHAGGPKAMEEIKRLQLTHRDAIIFTLPALAVNGIIRAAEAGYVLPPKSTWVIPKIPYGLLIQKHTPK